MPKPNEKPVQVWLDEVTHAALAKRAENNRRYVTQEARTIIESAVQAERNEPAKL